MVGSGALVVSDVVWIQHALHTFGGRRIESPQGGDTAGHPTPWHLAHRSQDMGDPRKHRHSRQTSCGSARSRPFFAYEWPNDMGQVGGKVFATQKGPQASLKDAQNLGKSDPDPPKLRPGASKIEPGALQDAIFKRHLT